MKNILVISLNNDETSYNVQIPEGLSVNEVAFGISVVIKCFVRDEIIEKPEQILSLINKYLSDPQFEEVKGDNNESN